MQLKSRTCSNTVRITKSSVELSHCPYVSRNRIKAVLNTGAQLRDCLCASLLARVYPD